MFYIGKEFDKKENKQYKTLDGAKKAADKADLYVFDEDGVKVHPLRVKLTDDVPDGALETNADEKINKYNEDGKKVGTITQEELAAAEASITEEEIEQATAAAKAEEAEQEPGKAEQEPGKAEQEPGKAEQEPEEAVHGKIRRVFEGKIRLRREPSMKESAICGVSLFDEKRVVKRIRTEDGIMYQTQDGYFISGDPKLVEFKPDPAES